MRWQILLWAVAPIAFATPALAQDGNNYRSKTVVVFGTDPCPKSTNPDEIVICARRPEEERFRIPKELREQEKAEIARKDQVGENRAALASGRNSATGVGSCSAAGAGGWTGCTQGINVLGAARTVVEGAKAATDPVDD